MAQNNKQMPFKVDKWSKNKDSKIGNKTKIPQKFTYNYHGFSQSHQVSTKIPNIQIIHRTLKWKNIVEDT